MIKNRNKNVLLCSLHICTKAVCMKKSSLSPLFSSGSSVIWEGIRAATGQENTAHNLYYKDASNFQPTTKLQQRIKLINDYWGGQAPKLVPAIDYTAQGGGK